MMFETKTPDYTDLSGKTKEYFVKTGLSSQEIERLRIHLQDALEPAA